MIQQAVRVPRIPYMDIRKTRSDTVDGVLLVDLINSVKKHAIRKDTHNHSPCVNTLLNIVGTMNFRNKGTLDTNIAERKQNSSM